MVAAGKIQDTAYRRACDGRLRGILRWPELDALWLRLLQRNDGGWYVYTIGQPPPRVPVSRDEFERFLETIGQRLRDEHKEDYCGIVYVDDAEEPGFLKIYDPGNLGLVCGSSAVPPLPGWTLSRVPPDDLVTARSGPDRRRHWWRRIFG